ncbi:hypothetical protein [Marinobacter salexigens]|uniref:hypothetical protein n=1 Tax=Marinobacter salexigens TaxID=1925763 RepID=UPI000C28F8F1|nr:hypothetical protein [Marinobacter salexigens]
MLIKKLPKYALFAIFLTSGVVNAQGNNQLPENHPLYDGKLDEFEIELAKKTAVANLEQIQERVMADLAEMLQANGDLEPMAVMMLNTGEIKPLKLAGEAKAAPDPVAVNMYRSALRSAARHEQILAASIVYPAKVEKDSNALALVIEFEHRLGVSAIRLTPYKIEEGKLIFGKSMQKDKPYQLFYDPKQSR